MSPAPLSRVTPIQGQPLQFLVQSRSNPTDFHTVNWLEGYCTCPSFHKQSKAHLEKTGSPLVCFHMTEAMKCGWDNYVDTVREHLLKQ